MNQLEITKRHHYIPQFFIKGFAGEDGKLAVFNKEIGELDKLRKSPKQIFFEWNRNTFNINGEDTDFVEKIYQFGESKFSETYKKIIEIQDATELLPYDLLHLMYFIAGIHWRVPNQDTDFLNCMKQVTPENSNFKITNKDTGENVTLELFDKIINEPVFIEASKMIRAMENFIGVKKRATLKDWKLYYVPPSNPQLNLLSDNPVIIRQNDNPNILNSELIFPLSKGKTIYHTNGKILNEISAHNRLKVDILAFLQSDKMVCGPDSKYLEDISKVAKKYDSKSGIEYLKEKIFEVFE